MSPYIYKPNKPQVKHRCETPKRKPWGSYADDGIYVGAVWQCPICGQYWILKISYISDYGPEIMFRRISKRRVHKIMARMKFKDA